MLFPTASFVLFFAAVFLGGWLVFSGKYSWRVFMLLASAVFYGLFDWRFLALLAVATLVGWALLKAIAAAKARTHPALARLLVMVAVLLHLGVLVWLKYLGFFAESVQALLGPLGLDAGWMVVQVAVPVGISFMVFRGISAAVDVFRGDTTAPSLLDYALFMAFFPYIAAGPVVRLREMVPQWQARRQPSLALTGRGLLLIASGLVKKLLIADYLARVAVNDVFATPHLFGSADVLAGIYAYAAQIYCDFSGYTDMAIGVALLLGVVLPPNFDAPYAADSLRSFWRRWHITLMRFMRDYVYIPLGGSRRGPARTSANLVFTLLLAGLWHGAGATFAVWGLLHGVGLAVERRLSDYAAEKNRRRLPRPIAWFLTLQFVCAGWVFFRADSLDTAFQIFRQAVVAWDVAPQLPVAAWVMVALVLLVQLVPATARKRIRSALASMPATLQAIVLALAVFAVAIAAAEGPAAFIYSGF